MSSESSRLSRCRWRNREEAREEFGIETVKGIDELHGIDAVVTVTDHDMFREDASLENLRKVSSEKTAIVDVRRMYEPEEAREAGFKYIGI